MKATGERETPSTILLIDDSPVDRFMAREALEQEGFRVIECDSGEAGLSACAEHLPDCVLLDVKMPRMNGFETCTALRAIEHGTHLPVLMLTGLDDMDSINRAYEAGATDFYSKPINCAVLIHRVRYLLRAKQTADELRRSQAQLAHAQRMAKLGHWARGGGGGGTRWSAEVESILGGTPALGADGDAPLLSHVYTDDRYKLEDAFERVTHTGGACSVEHRIVRPDGTERIVYQEIEALHDSAGNLVQLVGALQDTTERREAEAQVRHLAYYDNVTGLANRTLLKEHLGHAISRGERYGRTVAIMFLDLDHFKRINDTMGHSAGDELLRQVADRLAGCTRESDYLSRKVARANPDSADASGSGQTVARLGGDEFVILLPELRAPEDAAVVAQRIREAMAQPYLVGANELYVSTSIGISGYPMDGEDVDTLLKHADAAMYHAKAEGRDRYQFYTESMNARVLERLAMETSLRKALEQDEFILHYQPILSLRTGEVRAVEALLRWNKPGEGMVSPVQFIPIAEESGLIVPLGEWVLRQACHELMQWSARGIEGFRVSVNVSAAQFKKRGFDALVADALRDSGMSADRLELELTESVLMEDVESSAAMLRDLKSLGLQLAIDDFGTGYSSLAYLKRLPIDSLKIDQSFIRDIADDPDDAAIVAATIGLAQTLRLSVVAEGVQDRTQLDYLLERDCDACQGFLLARPMPASDLETWLASNSQESVLSAGRSLANAS